MEKIIANLQYRKFCAYGFLKNLRFFEAFILLFFIAEGLSFTQIGIIYAVREVLTNVFEFPSGLLADAFGRKRALLFSFVLYIFSFLLFYYGDNFYLLVIAMSIYGIGDAFRSGTHKGMIMDYLRMNDLLSNKVDYYGHTRSWSQIGSAVSAIAAGILVFIEGNYESIFLYACVPYLVNLFNVYSYPDEISFSTQGMNLSNNPRNILKSVFSSFKQIKVLWITYSSTIHAAFLKSIKDYIQPLIVSFSLSIPILLTISEEKKSALLVGLIYGIIFFLSALASKYSGALLEWKSKGLAGITLMLGLGLGVLTGWFYAMDFWFVSIVLFVGIYTIENLRKPILTGQITDAVAPEILTSVLSAQSFFQTILTAGISLGIGVLADKYGIAYGLMFVSAAVIGLTFLLAVLRARSSS